MHNFMSLSDLACVLKQVKWKRVHVPCLELRPHCDMMLHNTLVTHLNLINIQLASKINGILSKWGD